MRLADERLGIKKISAMIKRQRRGLMIGSKEKDEVIGLKIQLKKYRC